MSKLFYHLKIEDKVLIFIREKGVKRKLYLEILKELAEDVDKEALSFLIKQKNVSFLSKDTAAFNEISLAKSDVFKALKLLSDTQKLLFKNEKVTFEPILEASCFFEVDQNQIQLKVEILERAYGLNQLKVFHPSFCIHENKVIPIKTYLEKSWIKEFKDKTAIAQNDLRKLESRLDENDPEDPKIVYFEKKETTPTLILLDSRGMFSKQAIENMDLQTDLLELGFIKKEESYYCPLEKVVENLQFLIEMGWKVLDLEKKNIQLLTDMTIEVSLQENDIEVEGYISYGEEKIPLLEVQGAYRQKSTLHPLKNGQIALIDRQKIEQSLGKDLLNRSCLGFKSFEIGSLAKALDHSKEKSSKAKAFHEALVSFSGIEEKKAGNFFSGKLHSYQQKGLNWICFLYQYGLNGILADEMGLGKTVQVLAFFSRGCTLLPSLIVVPSSLLYQWEQEFKKFLPEEKVYIYYGTKRIKDIEILNKKRFILVSYALVRQEVELFKQMKLDTIILDEAQMIKNSETKTTKAVYQLSSKFRLSITGTPIENRKEELFSQFRFLFPAFEKKLRMDTKQAFRPFILRRLKNEVEKDLPEKIEQDIWVDMTPSQKQLYDRYLSNNQEIITSKDRIQALEKILRLRQICLHPHLVDPSIEAEYEMSGKINHLLSDLDTILAEKHKILIFSQFTSMLKIMQKRLQKFSTLYLDGTMSIKQRQKTVQAFQEDDTVQIFLISLKAGGYGLNLTQADYVYLMDPWWNESVERQAIDRAHRLGQTKTVIVKRYLTLSTIEEKLFELKNKKQQMAEDLIDPLENPQSLMEEDLFHLLS